jgi:hypothetical protein
VFHDMVIFYGEELLAPRPTPKLEGHPLSAVRDCLINVFAATLHIWRPFLHPQPEDALCRGDRDPLIMEGLHKSSCNWLLPVGNIWCFECHCALPVGNVCCQRVNDTSIKNVIIFPMQSQI